MTTLRDIFQAFAPEYLERSPHLPLSHHQVISAIQHCQSRHDGHRLSQCHRCGATPRVHPSCGNRHGPQCQHHTTQQWLQRHLAKQLPSPHVLLPVTVPEALRSFIRSHQRLASQALFKASATARKRLAKEQRCIGTDLPGFPGVLHTWGRQLQYHPHIHDMVPGGGLSEDRTTRLPSRANFSVPVKALSPIYRAICREDIRQAGLLESIDPQVWTIPWHGPSQTNPNGHTSCKYLAPYVYKVAISNRRIVSLTDRTVTFPYRTPGRARPRTTTLDAIECIRRFLQHGLPEGCMQVRHFGCMHPRWNLSTDTMQRMIVHLDPIGCKTPHIEAPAPVVASCPTCGKPMQLVRRLWTSNRVLLDTG